MDIASEEGIRSVVLRRSESSGMGLGLGFSIMGGLGYDFPPVIYGIEKDSPASRSGMLEAGDVILSINEREVVKLSTKEVLKCLRLSGDIVHIKFKRDLHVVSRVRQFLSTPNYLDGQDNHHHQSPSKQRSSKKNSQIPVYQYQPTPQQQTQPLSPNRSTSIPPYSHGGDGDRVSVTNRQNNTPGHISFTDELFINHSFQHQNLLCQHSPTNKPLINKHLISGVNNSEKLQQNDNSKAPNGRKNFETFVMTGDAILNVSRNDSNEAFKASPTKTTSKLTPMPHMPIFVERDKDYNRRILLEKEMQMERLEKEKEKSESETTASPPLPPPPEIHEINKDASNNDGNNSYSSDRIKSDQLPPPPPPDADVIDNVQKTKSFFHKNGHSNGEANVCNNMNNMTSLDDGDDGGHNHHGKYESNRCPNPNHQNNNEDTSISSSVMSDSGDDEILGGDDEDVKKMGGTSATSFNGNRAQLKVAATKSISVESYDPERERDSEVAEVVAEKTSVHHERERYNEYILLNGSRGTLNDDESGSGRQSAQQYSYSQAINRDEKTPSTGHDRFDGGDSEGDVDSASENDNIGTCDRLSSSHLGGGGGNESGGSFSGGESDSSDVESMRVAPVTKAVDLPSAERLAKRLFQLDGFKSTDVWRHLSKNTDFNRIVAVEYLNFFTFKDETLDISLRKFLTVCPLRGETQDRERVLSYFSGRYVECNPETFGTQDSVHTLACALMLLNTDIYSGIRSQRMTCSEFIENLSGLNEGGDFPRDVLKQLYLSIRSQPLVSPNDADDEDSTKDILPMDPPVGSASNVEFKRGYLVRKCTHELGGKKTPLGKRSWKMFFCRLKELLLVLTPDESSKLPVQNAFQIKLHHAFAITATDYRKRRNVLRIILSDRTQFLFQSSDTREMHSWIDMINWNAARFSSPALEAPCSSTGRFEKPLLPSGISRMSRREQCVTHQAAVAHWEKELDTLTQPKKKGSSSSRKEDKEKLIFYQYEIRRYRTYVDVLEKRASPDATERMQNGGGEEIVELQLLPNPPVLMEEDS